MKRFLLLGTALLTLFTASTVCAEEITIATGQTFIKKVLSPIKSAFREKTGIDLRILYNDPAPALAELEKGNVEVAGASLPLEDWLKRARKEGVAVKESSAYNSYIPVTEKTMIMINADNKVKSLSKEQLKQVFTGRIQNWKEVGGEDSQILVVWPSVSSGALLIFSDKILDNEPLTKSIYDVETVADTAGAIAATPEAIGIVSGVLNHGGIKEVYPPIERPLTLVFKGKPSANLQKLLDFLKREGKQYIQ